MAPTGGAAAPRPWCGLDLAYAGFTFLRCRDRSELLLRPRNPSSVPSRWFDDRHPLRYAEQTRGTLTNFLEAQTTALSINGGAAIDATNLYSAPFFVPDLAGTNNGVWEAGFDTPTGITLTNPGDSLTSHIKLAVSHPVAEVLNPADGGSAGKPGIIGPGTVIDGDCTVIAT